MEKLLGTLSKGMLIVMSAPAGTGKTTMAHMLLDEFRCISKSVSCTTRSKRPGEVKDKDYHFLSREEFNQKKKAGAFLEHADVFNHQYGTLQEDVEKKLESGQHVLLVIDTQGAEQLRKFDYPALSIFIKPPSMGELRARLIKRKTEADEHIEKRLAFAEHELEMASHYDYIITNDNLHHAYEILRSILIAEEHKTERYHDRIFN